MPAYINPADIIKIGVMAVLAIWAFNKAAESAGVPEFKVEQ